MSPLESLQVEQLLRDIVQIGARMDALRVAAEQAGVSLTGLTARFHEPPIIEEDLL